MVIYNTFGGAHINSD